MQTIIAKIMANKHTTSAAFVYGVCFLAGKIAGVWFPGHSDKIDQTLSLIKDFATVYGFALAGDGGTQPTTTPEDSGTSTKSNTMKTLSILFALAALSLGALGCSSTVTTGHVVSVTDRFIGLHYSQNTVNPTSPDVVFGFGSSTVVVMPTETNKNLTVPSIANTFSMSQTGTTFLLPVIDETFASGNYSTGNASNNVQAQPLVPYISGLPPSSTTPAKQ